MSDTPKVPHKEAEYLYPQIADTADNWKRHSINLPPNFLAIDTTNKIIKIGDGHPFTETKNHTHDAQYSNLTHQHYFGYGEQWFRTNPKLWLKDDIKNHPELVELNGTYLDDERAALLADTYASEIELHHPIFDMTCDDYRVVSSSTNSTVDKPYAAFGPELDIHNAFDVTDQWIVSHGSDTEAWIGIEKVGTAKYAPKSYTFTTRCGTVDSPFCKVATPKRWAFETSDDGATWVVIHTAELPDYIGNNKPYTVPVTQPCVDTRFMRIRILEWHMPDVAEGPQQVGLHRVSFKGYRKGSFALPYCASPHPDFSWVIPIADLNIGMKHEEIGDIGTTGNVQPLRQKNRMLADGRALKIHEYNQLFGCYMHQHAPWREPYLAESTVGLAVIKQQITVVTIPNDIDLSTPTITTLRYKTGPFHFGKYTIGFDNPMCYGVDWTIEGEEHGQWTVLSTVKGNTSTFSRHVITEHATCTAIRIIVTKWSKQVSISTTLEVEMAGSSEGFFHIPDMAVDGDTNSYVVTEVRTEDINAGVVLDLQEVIGKLQAQLTTAISRLSDAEYEIQQLKLKGA